MTTCAASRNTDRSGKTRRRWTSLAVVMLAAVPAFTAPPAGAQEPGAAIYRGSCAACHQPDGSGVPGVFPPLAGNPRVEDTGYVRTVIREGLSGPIEVDGTAYDGTMPALAQLSDGDVEAVIVYLQQGLGDAGTGGAEADPRLGRALFLGSTEFTHGGPACSACHSAGTVSDFSALPATLGPDLTGITMSAAELVTAVQGHEMSLGAASYTTDTLTPGELASVAAFLETAAEEEATSLGDGLVLTALGLLILLLTATSLVASNRRERRSAGVAP